MEKRYTCESGHEGGGFEYCEECFKKQQAIDKLKTENEHLRAQLRYRKTKGTFSSRFGASTPSSKIEIKASSEETDQKKQGGAPKGRAGSGRKQFGETEADEVHTLRVKATACSDCGGKWKAEGLRIDVSSMLCSPKPADSCTNVRSNNVVDAENK